MTAYFFLTIFVSIFDSMSAFAEMLGGVVGLYAAVILLLGTTIFWFFFGVSIFERCMTSEGTP